MPFIPETSLALTGVFGLRPTLCPGGGNNAASLVKVVQNCTHCQSVSGAHKSGISPPNSPSNSIHPYWAFAGFSPRRGGRSVARIRSCSNFPLLTLNTGAIRGRRGVRRGSSVTFFFKKRPCYRVLADLPAYKCARPLTFRPPPPPCWPNWQTGIGGGEDEEGNLSKACWKRRKERKRSGLGLHWTKEKRGRKTLRSIASVPTSPWSYCIWDRQRGRGEELPVSYVAERGVQLGRELPARTFVAFADAN